MCLGNSEQLFSLHVRKRGFSNNFRVTKCEGRIEYLIKMEDVCEEFSVEILVSLTSFRVDVFGEPNMTSRNYHLIKGSEEALALQSIFDLWGSVKDKLNGSTKLFQSS